MVKFNESERMISKTADEYSLNQCSLMVRVDGQELEVPLNFGMTSDEIARLYPYILQFASVPIKNPAVEFGKMKDEDKYMDMSEDEVDALLNKINMQSRYWYGKSEASLLEIAIRFALDIKLRGIQELIDIFESESPIDKIKSSDVKQLDDDEVERAVRDMNLETDIDHEYDAGDEHDIPLGIAGQLHVNVYDSGFSEDFLSDELDRMEAEKAVEDDFDEMLKRAGSNIDEDRYKSDYDSKKSYDEKDIKDGLLNFYGDADVEADAYLHDYDKSENISRNPVTDIQKELDPKSVGKVPLSANSSSVAFSDGLDWDTEDKVED